MNRMNIYKLTLMVKEFPFLDEILRKRESNHLRGDDHFLDLDVKRYGDKLGFRTEEDSNYCFVSYLETPDGVSVKKGDENLLTRTPFIDQYSWSGGGHYYEDSYFAVVGEELVELDSASIEKSGSQHEPDGEETAPTIGEQLLLKKLDPDFIVHRHLDADDDNNCHSKTVTIYKMKKYDLAEYHCRQIDKAAAELKAEITSVCKEAPDEKKV